MWTGTSASKKQKEHLNKAERPEKGSLLLFPLDRVFDPKVPNLRIRPANASFGSLMVCRFQMLAWIGSISHFITTARCGSVAEEDNPSLKDAVFTQSREALDFGRCDDA